MPRTLASLGGAAFRMRPLVDATVVGPVQAVAGQCLFDTGADDTIFPDSIARRIGIDLSNAPTATMVGVGGRPQIIRYASARLRLTDGIEYRDWPAWIGFTAIPLALPLLGWTGCLQFFTATFYGDREQVELSVNSLYPGT